MESFPDQKPRLGDQAAPEPRLIAASWGLVARRFTRCELRSDS